jgi:predicted signal transduction protein with EAL and GGDEF domain
MTEQRVRSFRLFRPKKPRPWSNAEWAVAAIAIGVVDFWLTVDLGGYHTLPSLPGSIATMVLAWWTFFRKDPAEVNGARPWGARLAARATVWVSAVVTTLMVLKCLYDIAEVGA